MSGYTVQNLKNVEDQAPKFGLSPQLEARMARVPLELEQFGISYQRIAPGFRVPWGHTHNVQEEVYVVVSGSMLAKLNEDVVELKQWDAVRVPKETMRWTFRTYFQSYFAAGRVGEDRKPVCGASHLTASGFGCSRQPDR